MWTSVPGCWWGVVDAATARKPLLYSFPHRTFQEYLAGCQLLAEPAVRKAFSEHAQDGDRWHLAAELALEELWYNRSVPEFYFDLLGFFCGPNPPKSKRVGV